MTTPINDEPRDTSEALHLIMSSNSALNILMMLQSLQEQSGFARLPQKTLDCLQEADAQLHAAAHEIEDQAFACPTAGPFYRHMRNSFTDVPEDDEEE